MPIFIEVWEAWLDRRLRHRPLMRKIVWFGVIYLASVVVFGIVAFGLQALVPT